AVDLSSRDNVRARLEHSGRELIEITLDQMHEFCGNVLELENASGDRLVVGSSRAGRAFTDEQRSAIQKSVDFVAVSLDTIEKYGGGSARCMLAELN
ncbi:MAG: arginine deiminase-related protein, partial [Gemmatimonadota bacterium]